MNGIRHIAMAGQASVAAFAGFERQVHVWNLQSLGAMASLATILDLGGRRLSLSPDGARCVAGAYHAEGVACHDVCSGALVWQRKDIRKLQLVRHALDQPVVRCFFDRSPAQVISASNGETLATLRGVRDVVESPYASVDLIEKGDLELRSRQGQLIRKLRRTTFALLSACFSPRHLMVSESGGPVRCVDLVTGQEAWRFEPDAGHHFLEIGHVRSTGCFFGVDWPFERGGSKRLFRLDVDERMALPVLSLGSPDTIAFDGQGEQLVTSDGRLIDLRTLVVRRLWLPAETEAGGEPAG
jgi:hypothetical protein